MKKAKDKRRFSLPSFGYSETKSARSRGQPPQNAHDELAVMTGVQPDQSPPSYSASINKVRPTEVSQEGVAMLSSHVRRCSDSRIPRMITLEQSPLSSITSMEQKLIVLDEGLYFQNYMLTCFRECGATGTFRSTDQTAICYKNF